MRSLREIAEAATLGPWVLASEEYAGITDHTILNGKVGAGQHAIATSSSVFSRRAGDDAEFIAAFDPTTVLALLDVAEAASELNDVSRALGDGGVRDADFTALSEALDRLREVAP